MIPTAAEEIDQRQTAKELEDEEEGTALHCTAGTDQQKQNAA